MPGHTSMYIMPHGKTLTHYLSLEEEKKNKKNKPITRQEIIWQQLKKQTEYNNTIFPNNDDYKEIDIIMKLGHKKRIRWINDRILRDMAGPLTATDMESCFKPPPWGDKPKPSPFEILSNYSYLYNLLINVTYEKQCDNLKTLEKLLISKMNKKNCCVVALKKWKKINEIYKENLKLVDLDILIDLESLIINFITNNGVNEMTMEDKSEILKNAILGICQYYKMSFKVLRKKESHLSNIDKLYDIGIYKDWRFFKSIKNDNSHDVIQSELKITCVDVLFAYQKIKGKKLNAEKLEEILKNKITS